MILARHLPDKKGLHLSHGPIDLIISVTAQTGTHEQAALRAATERFDGLLEELVEELPLLRTPIDKVPHQPAGPIARRMAVAVAPHAGRFFITPMAAVAGAVAEEVLSAMMAAARLDRAFVNNGGDIAFHLIPGCSFAVALAGLDGHRFGDVTITGDMPVRGIASSGRGGRSHSLGIADNVTVFAASAAAADAAATLIANAVDLPGHAAVKREPADSLSPDTDLGDRPVVVGRGYLTEAEVNAALTPGAVLAEEMRRNGWIEAAGLFLSGQSRLVANPALRKGGMERRHIDA
ncbi:MAG: UPF0280 family protein [Rhodobacteraceae bacterium]|nr:UPF0280 family protein [Paracoccaceae bacterium]